MQLSSSVARRARCAVLACVVLGALGIACDEGQVVGPAADVAPAAADLYATELGATMQDARPADGPHGVDAGQGGDGPVLDLPPAAADSAPPVDAAPKPDAGPTCPLTLYVSPTGNDSHDGSTKAKAVATLSRVHALVKAKNPVCDVEVRVKQGTYSGQTVSWSWRRAGVTVKIMPIDYHGGGINSIAGRPVFDGQGASFFFRVASSSGAKTNVQLIYLQVQHYVSYAVHFYGNRNDESGGWNGGNRVFGCLFKDIGGLGNGGGTGYAGIDLVNSVENEISNNHFVNLQNSGGDAALIHGIYLAHHSRKNTITQNRFQTVSGDPIRARDNSNFNEIRNNRFYDTGVKAFYSDWFCDKTVSTCTKASGECPSWENEFRDNELHCGYSGGTISTFAYLRGGVSYVPAWCPDNSAKGWARLHTSGNTKACP